MAVGRTAAKRVGAAYFSNPSFSTSWKSLHAEVSKSGDLGFTTGTYDASYKGPDGKTVNDKWKYVCNWKMQTNGNWKAIHDIWNADAKQADPGRAIDGADGGPWILIPPAEHSPAIECRRRPRHRSHSCPPA